MRESDKDDPNCTRLQGMDDCAGENTWEDPEVERGGNTWKARCYSNLKITLNVFRVS